MRSHQKKTINGAAYKVNTAEDAIDSKCVIGSPTYLTVLLKYKSWLKTFSACMDKDCFYMQSRAFTIRQPMVGLAQLVILNFNIQ